MQATLIYNANAGSITQAKVNDLQDGLRDAGYEPVYKATDTIDDLNPILAEARGLVVSAGGDGTAREVITRLVGRDDIRFLPLPMGTANNICRTLGVAGKPLEIVQRLGSPQECTLDIGHLQAPWGEDFFVEGAGVGFFAEILAQYNPEEGKSVLRSVQTIIDILQQGCSRELTIHLPDRQIAGNFLLVEALNTAAVGPRLKFAPDADPTDGLLNIVCVREDEREGYLQYLHGLLAEELHELDSVETYRVPELRISWSGFPVHVDAVVHPPGHNFREGDSQMAPFTFHPYPFTAAEPTIAIRLLAQALQLWLPAPQEATAATLA
ncbi:MAG: NAD(+)/NADH kinase [Anaerolineales bacterium]|nr:NAD(+)/NADH kinase [Anaerolineales bacterium]MCB0014114.1 NAD(+)/NADH kinase [Anaerolineales bacterium]MCB0016867.1 NAD(+)/NADH kinase [Anaerolineales bacterium]MCB8960952.1 NAD(+)/NADH kinase [Ardenticatenales bacterium]